MAHIRHFNLWQAGDSVRQSFAVCLLSLLLLTAAHGIAAAQPTVRTSKDATGTQRSAGRRGVLLLTSGRVTGGIIRQSPNGYVVAKPNGQFTIPFSQVELAGNDLTDIYEKLRRLKPYYTASQRIELAQWCIVNQLYPQARNELLNALKLDPDNQRARRTLQRLNEVLNPRRESESPETASDRQRTSSGFQQPDSTSLAGLSRPLAREFVRTIQPILLNSCGNAGCHGRESSNDFRLTHVRIGHSSQRVLVERNLAAILRHVDSQRPTASPVLRRAHKPHGDGRLGRSYSGMGSRHWATLRKWVHAVAAHQAKQRGFDDRLFAEKRHMPGSASKPGGDPTGVVGDLDDPNSPASNSADITPPSRNSGAGTLGSADTADNRAAFPVQPPSVSQTLPWLQEVRREGGIPRSSKPGEAAENSTPDADSTDPSGARDLLREPSEDAFDPSLFNQLPRK